MQVLEHEHERSLLGGRLDQPAPRGERLGAVGAPGTLEADEETRMTGDPRAVVFVVEDRLE